MRRMAVTLLAAGLVFMTLGRPGAFPGKAEGNRLAEEQVEAVTANRGSDEKGAKDWAQKQKARCAKLAAEVRRKDTACVTVECPGFSPDIYEAAMAGKVRLGMDPCLVRIAWGKPDRVKRTVTADKTSERWLYGDRYVDFEDDVVVARQE